MRKLKVEKIIKIDYEAVIKVEINKITNETDITISKGFLEGQFFVPVVEEEKIYKIKNAAEELSELDYFIEVDKQNSPTLLYYGLLYIAKQEEIYIKYSTKAPNDDLSVSVTGTTITVKIEPLITTNQQIVDVINTSNAAKVLIYLPEIIDAAADVDAPDIPKEIK